MNLTGLGVCTKQETGGNISLPRYYQDYIIFTKCNDRYLHQATDTAVQRKVRRKKKSGNRLCHSGGVYSCRKSNDIFLKELASELGVCDMYFFILGATRFEPSI